MLANIILQRSLTVWLGEEELVTLALVRKQETEASQYIRFVGRHKMLLVSTQMVEGIGACYYLNDTGYWDLSMHQILKKKAQV
jgi:hypothetical protein